MKTALSAIKNIHMLHIKLTTIIISLYNNSLYS